MSSSKTKSNGASIFAKNLQQSISPHRRSSSSTISSSSSATASSMSIFSSPNRINLHCGLYFTPSPAVQFSIDYRNGSPRRSVTIDHRIGSSPSRSVTSSSRKEKNQNDDQSNRNKAWSNGHKQTCMCSPTTHPGSFRCRMHKNLNNTNDNHGNSSASYHSHRLYARRSAMTNSLVRIGTVEGDLVKRALASLIRPSSHQQRRRGDFHPRPSRLSVMSKAED